MAILSPGDKNDSFRAYNSVPISLFPETGYIYITEFWNDKKTAIVMRDYMSY